MTSMWGEFSELRVSDGINVDYTSDPDKAGRAFFNCPAQQASSFMFTNKGGRLTIQLSPEIIGARNLPTITVHSKHLTKVENTSDSTVRVLSLNGLPKLEARLEGNGHLIVRGIDATEVKGTLRLGHGTLILTGKCKGGQAQSYRHGSDSGRRTCGRGSYCQCQRHRVGGRKCRKRARRVWHGQHIGLLYRFA